MPSSIARLVFAIGIAGLFWLNRDRTERLSKALWLPTIWLAISGSRSVSSWLGMGPDRGYAGQAVPTSSLDQAVAASLMLLGLITLFRRGKDVTRVLKGAWPIVAYFSYCVLSLFWSDFADWGFKRWIRALGDLIMVLVIATDAQPAAALRRVFSRVGFVLLPCSVLLIKYYPYIGQAFDAWGGAREFIGVTTDKNVLGEICFVLGLGALWQLIRLYRDKELPNRNRQLIAQGVLLAFAINILFTAHCATAGACFTLGTCLMLAMSLPVFRRRPANLHVLVGVLLVGGGLFALSGGWSTMTAAVGRKPDLTGRTVIWHIVIPMVTNPLGGAGFETFWLGPRVQKIYEAVGGPQMTNEAHNGYIEMYLNLGILGLCFVALILTFGYFKAVRAFRRDNALGALLVVYVVMSVIYSVSEAGFRMLSVSWFFLLLSVIAATRIGSLAQAPVPVPQPAAPPKLTVGPARRPALQMAGRRR